jgi:hypothetical protein
MRWARNWNALSKIVDVRSDMISALIWLYQGRRTSRARVAQGHYGSKDRLG